MHVIQTRQLFQFYADAITIETRVMSDPPVHNYTPFSL